MMQVVVATGNAGKMREFARIFAPYGIEAVAQNQLLPDLSVEETGQTFEENAYLKAEAVHRLTGRAAVADDSGLCVDALSGAPGVYSARYAGEQTPYTQKIEKLLDELGGIPVDWRTAKFVAHICFIAEDGTRMDFEEVCRGYIGAEPKGENGFGFDPVFMIGQRSFSELSDAEKDEISHRGKALRKLADYLSERYGTTQEFKNRQGNGE